MITISKLMLKDVRCFEGRKEFNIRPLTFLVGENSTGKSTALGCFQALSDFLLPRNLGGIDFNNEPYQMGAFSDIARKTKSLSKAFVLGFEIGKIKYSLTLVAREDGSEPIIQEVRMDFSDGGIIVKIKQSKNRESLERKSGLENIDAREEEGNRFIVSIDVDKTYFYWLTSPSDIYSFFDMYKEEVNKEVFTVLENFTNYLKKCAKRKGYEGLRRHDIRGIRAYSFAPIRSKPERTYNPLKETASPEGSEMPMILMNLNMSSKREWEHLKERLEDFGKASGLFTGIGVRKLGRSMSDPFQLQIKVRGPKGNIVDVGYGISQILPILVRILMARNSRFLLQQPEVHLHPKGQAELISLLIDLKNDENSFIVETHSDAMINRARIEIIKGKLKPNEVSLIYLEPVGNKVEVHNISFDTGANMIGAPDSYHDFFLKEHNKLLGFGG